MKTLAVITTFPPNRWNAYAKRMLESHVKFWPNDVKIYAYYEGTQPDLQHDKIKYINIEEENPELVQFKNKHKNDPVANGELQQIPGGVRRDGEASYAGNPKHVYDASDFIRYKKLKTINQMYNDKSFGGDESYAQQHAWRRVRR